MYRFDFNYSHPSAYVGYGKSGPSVYSATLGHLYRDKPTACHSAQPTGVFAGTHPKAQRESEPSETAQLVCADCQGKERVWLWLFILNSLKSAGGERLCSK